MCTIETSPQTLGCRPIASVDHFLPENLGSAELVEEIQTGSSKIVKVEVVVILCAFLFTTNITFITWGNMHILYRVSGLK